MAKHNYTATFADGTILTRKSERPYAAAYLVTAEFADGSGRYVCGSGFARTADLAAKAAEQFGYESRFKKPYGSATVRVGTFPGRRAEIVAVTQA